MCDSEPWYVRHRSGSLYFRVHEIFTVASLATAVHGPASNHSARLWLSVNTPALLYRNMFHNVAVNTCSYVVCQINILTHIDLNQAYILSSPYISTKYATGIVFEWLLEYMSMCSYYLVCNRDAIRHFHHTVFQRSKWLIFRYRFWTTNMKYIY